MKHLPILLTALVVGCNGCQPQPQPAPPPVPTVTPPAPTDGGPRRIGDAYDDACSVLAAAGCPEGQDPTCAATMRRTDAKGITIVPLSCLTGAHTASQIRACGFVTCGGQP